MFSSRHQDEIEAVTGMVDLAASDKGCSRFWRRNSHSNTRREGRGAFNRGGLYEIPAYTPNKLVDPTGAGDAFIGVFWQNTFGAKKLSMVCVCWSRGGLNCC
jgi:sugar/nucleoside kinase (ribokinase family)